MKSLERPDEDVKTSITQVEAQRMLSRAVGDARLLGAIFCILGVLFCIPAMMPSGRFAYSLLTLSAAVLLLGPGVLYVIAAEALKHRRPSGAILARRAGSAHLIGCAGCIAIGSIFGGLGGYGWLLIAPAVAMVFFVPALIAFLAGTRSALRAAESLDARGRAFEPVVAQVVSDQTRSDQHPSATTPQPIVKPRLK